MHYSQLKTEEKKFGVYAVLEFDHGDRFVPCELVLEEEGYFWESLETGGRPSDVPIKIHTFNNKSKALEWVEYKNNPRKPPHWCL